MRPAEILLQGVARRGRPISPPREGGRRGGGDARVSCTASWKKEPRSGCRGLGEQSSVPTGKSCQSKRGVAAEPAVTWRSSCHDLLPSESEGDRLHQPGVSQVVGLGGGANKVALRPVP